MQVKESERRRSLRLKELELEHVDKRRRFLYEEEEVPDLPRSQFAGSSDLPVPEWLPTEDYIDEVLGEIKSGKEGDVQLVERKSPDKSCLLALKQYRPRNQRAFKKDQIYREGIRFRYARDARAVATGTRYGWDLVNNSWFFSEYEALKRLWEAGCSVPYPVSQESGLLMQFIGDWDQAAPRLVDARITKEQAPDLLDQVIENVRLMAREEMAHCDLSAYNILVWDDRAWIIDFPQSINIAANPNGISLLHRDLVNVCGYFAKFGVDRDPDVVLAEILSELFIVH